MLCQERIKTLSSSPRLETPKIKSSAISARPGGQGWGNGGGARMCGVVWRVPNGGASHSFILLIPLCLSFFFFFTQTLCYCNSLSDSSAAERGGVEVEGEKEGGG